MFHIVIGIDNANPTENTSMSIGQVVLGTKQNFYLFRHEHN